MSSRPIASASATESLTRSTGRIDLFEPDWRRVDIEDIALSLARQPRFNGQTWRTVSVLEHSLAVARMMPARYRLAALLHDARESYLGDLTRPAVAVVDRIAGHGGLFFNVIEGVGQRLDGAIAYRVLNVGGLLGLNRDALAAAAIRLSIEMAGEPVKTADDLACHLELRLFGSKEPPEDTTLAGWNHYAKDLPVADALISEWIAAVDAAVQEFLARCRGLAR